MLTLRSRCSDKVASFQATAVLVLVLNSQRPPSLLLIRALQARVHNSSVFSGCYLPSKRCQRIHQAASCTERSRKMRKTVIWLYAATAKDGQFEQQYSCQFSCLPLQLDRLQPLRSHLTGMILEDGFQQVRRKVFRGRVTTSLGRLYNNFWLLHTSSLT